MVLTGKAAAAILKKFKSYFWEVFSLLLEMHNPILV